MTQTIRVMTWNVHGVFSLNPGFDLAGVIALVRKWSPDIVALQEIDSRGRSEDPFAAIEEALGHGVRAVSIATADGHYGQMLVSRWPWWQEPRITDISFPEREPRRAIAGDIDTPQGCLRVVSTHLGLSVRERHAQVQALLELADTPHPAVLAGDFNDWFWVNSVRGALGRHFPVRTRHRTFPAFWPLMRLDRIYAHAAVDLVRSAIDTDARRFSDHLPVIADFALASA